MRFVAYVWCSLCVCVSCAGKKLTSADDVNVNRDAGAKASGETASASRKAQADNLDRLGEFVESLKRGSKR